MHFMRIKKNEHEIEQLKHTTVSLKSMEENTARMEAKFKQLEYADTDIRNIIRSTDEYLEVFLPFKLLKMMGKYMIEIFGDEIEQSVIISERDKIKALYLSMLDDETP